MMNTFLFAAGTALWLGILTSISPCPLTTNIAAISFIGKRVGNKGSVLLAGLLYTLGRSVAYVGLGSLIIAGAFTVPGAANFLQSFLNRLLGPILIIIGMVLLELITLRLPGMPKGERVQQFAERGGLFGSLLLGILFALSFCPISAGLFFLSLIPLAIAQRSVFVLPSLYGVGSGLPVVVFAVLLALGTQYLGMAFNRLSSFEWWARRVTGVVFIIVGIYHSLRYIYGLAI